MNCQMPSKTRSPFYVISTFLSNIFFGEDEEEKRIPHPLAPQEDNKRASVRGETTMPSSLPLEETRGEEKCEEESEEETATPSSHLAEQQEEESGVKEAPMPGLPLANGDVNNIEEETRLLRPTLQGEQKIVTSEEDNAILLPNRLGDEWEKERTVKASLSPRSSLREIEQEKEKKIQAKAVGLDLLLREERQEKESAWKEIALLRSQLQEAKQEKEKSEEKAALFESRFVRTGQTCAELYFMKKQEEEEKENAVKEAQSIRLLMEQAMREKEKFEETAKKEQQKNGNAEREITSLRLLIANEEEETIKANEEAAFEKQKAKHALRETAMLRLHLTNEKEETVKANEKAAHEKQKAESALKEIESLHLLLTKEQEEKVKADEKVSELLSLLEEEKQKTVRADEDTAKLMACMDAEYQSREKRLANKTQSLEILKQQLEEKENAIERRMKEVSEKEKQATEKTEEMIKYDGFPTPEYWDWQGYQCTVMSESRLKKISILPDWIKGMLNKTMLHIGGCNAAGRAGSDFLRNMKSVQVWRIEDPIIWKPYAQKKEEMIRLNESDGVTAPPLNLRKNCPFPHEIIDEKVNEVRLWHGTKRIKNTTRPVDMIVHGGFDERVSSPGLYGEGIYFASHSCKAAQYCHDQKSQRDNTYVLFYCRVLLGNPYAAKGDMSTVKRPPSRDPTRPWRLHDSVIAKQGTPTSHGNQVHEEYIVYDRRQVYPEYEVRIIC